MDNRQYRNVVGKHGDLTKNQKDKVTSVAVYGENVFGLTSRLSGVLGARAEKATRRTNDFFLSNGDQSDDRSYSPVTPRIGFLFAMRPDAQMYGNVSRTYEPPLLLELRRS